MLIRELYEKSIDREINPAVIVSQQDPQIVETEIEEYVFTRELAEKLYKFLNTFLMRKEGNTGIWINGYYGSGKSHFIKFIHYCLNIETREKAFDHLLKAIEGFEPDPGSDLTLSKVVELKEKLKKMTVEDIMFNVEAETGDETIKERLTRIFLRQLNRHRGYNGFNIPLAMYFEKHLDKHGKFEEFKNELKSKYHFTWEKDADDLLATRLSMILDVAQRLDPELDKKALHKTLTDPDNITIKISDIFIKEFNEYIEEKPAGFRLLILVDEISQYVGKNRDILLNLQTIVEEIGRNCNNKVWIACTAQQSLDSLVEKMSTSDVKDEFGKILGRFNPEHNRISLESTDAAFITQKRVLDKNSSGEKELCALFKKQEDAITMQFRLHHELYKGFEAEDDFVLAYPFVPYQFRLISNVFESFQNLDYVIREVKDNERSILGITHYTAKQNADLEVGTFIPFDAFFNNQFTSNMQHRGRKAVEPALSLKFVQNDRFASRVVKVLFMISNLSDTTRQTFPSNLDNIVLLLMSRLDENKMELQKNVRKVLEKLIEENIIREENGNYYFFNEDEIDVTHEIRNTVPTLDEKLKEFGDLISPMLNVNRKVDFGSGTFTISYRIDDKQFFKGENGEFTVVLYESKDANVLAMENSKDSLLLCANEWFSSDPEFKKEFEWYCKTSEYLLHHASGTTGQRTETLNNFRVRNGRLKDNLTIKLSGKIASFRFISGQTVINPGDLNGAKPKERYQSAVSKHFGNIYPYLHLSDKYMQTAADLRKKISAPGYQTSMITVLTEPETLVNDEISNRANEVTLFDLVTFFGKAPYGWKDIAVIDMVLELYRKKYRIIEYRHEPRYPLKDFVEKAFNASERHVCVVKSGEEMAPEEIEAAMKNFRDIFNTDLRAKKEPDTVFDEIVSTLSGLVSAAQGQVSEYGRYPFGSIIVDYQTIISDLAKIREPKRLFKQLKDEKENLKAQTDRYKSISGFVNERIKKYDEIRDFLINNKDNLAALYGNVADKMTWLEEYFTKKNPEDELRIAAKSYDELKSALKLRIEEERKAAMEVYSGIFEVLDKKAKEVKSDRTIYADRESKLESIKKEKSLTALSLMMKKAEDFKTGELQKILQWESDEKKKKGEQAAEPVVVYAKDSCDGELRTEDDVNRYVEKLRKGLLEKIKSKKIIIIN